MRTPTCRSRRRTLRRWRCTASSASRLRIRTTTVGRRRACRDERRGDRRRLRRELGARLARATRSCATAESCTGRSRGRRDHRYRGQLGVVRARLRDLHERGQDGVLGVAAATLDAQARCPRPPPARWPRARCAQPRRISPWPSPASRARRREPRQAGRHGVFRVGPRADGITTRHFAGIGGGAGRPSRRAPRMIAALDVAVSLAACGPGRADLSQ